MASKTEQETEEKEDTLNEIWDNPMKRPFLEKVVLNIGVGTGGEELERAVSVLGEISGKEPVKTLAKVNVKEFNIRKGRPIGTKVTVRGEEAEKLLKRLLVVNDNKVLKKSFDNYGNFGFGIKEHISIPGVEYDTRIGILGLDVCARIIRPGMRVKIRKAPKKAKIPKEHYVSKEEAQQFLEEKFNTKIVEKIVREY
ncbi:MAG: 50S ribosomal protein L5 [Candidatus Lokiarchaeota archaeon]|nr:50S ribosomal protein L5 [Candidatus Lokiarchaeota archaeon]